MIMLLNFSFSLPIIAKRKNMQYKKGRDCNSFYTLNSYFYSECADTLVYFLKSQKV